ncbi:DUF4177 domain-containing protein [Pseudomonas baltica]|uniref:DUF4177 domain-containing protein n=2 Tax=Pseudomonas TaxID=286 RepID=A0A7X1G397_9PSED|nr:DUF4177 domain-containing protein [Pseudomonas baltica]MBC2677691.1 DUF4177 domain-containing protein [Pseudomonas baltica]
MKSLAWRKTWLIGAWLLLNTSLAAGIEYSTYLLPLSELMGYLNKYSKDGWKLKNINTWTEGCPNNQKMCFVVIMEKE